MCSFLYRASSSVKANICCCSVWVHYLKSHIGNKTNTSLKRDSSSNGVLKKKSNADLKVSRPFPIHLFLIRYFIIARGCFQYMCFLLLLQSAVFSLGMKCLSCIIRSKLCIYGPSLRTPMCDIVSYGDGVLLYPLVHFTKNLLIELVVRGLQAALCTLQ